MKYSEYKEGDAVMVMMPQKSTGFEHPQEAVVVEKGKNGVVLLQKPNLRRWWTSASRVKSVVSKSIKSSDIE